MEIIQAVYPVLGAGSHYFYVLKNDSGQVIGQLNGLQVKDGLPSASGVGGTLQVRTDYGMPYDSSTVQKIVAIADSATIMKMWDSALACGAVINQMNYNYNALDSFGGHNSNAAFATLAACMQLEVFDLGGLAPGLTDIILSLETIRVIQQQHGLAPADGGGGGGGDGNIGGDVPGGGDANPPGTGGPKDGTVIVIPGFGSDPVEPVTRVEDPFGHANTTPIGHESIVLIGLPEASF